MPDGANKSVVSPSASANECLFLINADESTFLRLPFVKRHREATTSPVDSFTVTVALPLSYEKSKAAKYPLLILSSGQHFIGSAIELTRGLALSKEAGACIIVNHDDALLAEGDSGLQAAKIEKIIAWCRSRFRVKPGEVAILLSQHNAASISALMDTSRAVVDRIVIADANIESAKWVQQVAVLREGRPSIAWSTRKLALAMTSNGIAHHRLDEASDEGCVVPALIHGVRAFWSTGLLYGDEMMPLSRPWVSAVLSRAVPFISFLRKPFGESSNKGGEPSRYVFQSKILGRNFEIFVSLPASPPRSAAGYPAIVALDANSTWSTVMETAARMADANEIEDVVAIGIGVPRSEGDISFGLRRFEELSPPVDAAAWVNPLGRFFVSIFAMFGRNATKHFGLAPQFHQFLTQELLPTLTPILPIDPSRLHLVGHSAAGTYVAYEAAQADTPFKFFGALSPGVAISDSWMLKRDGGLAKSGNELDMLVTIGGDERSNAFNTLAGIPQSERYASEMKADALCNVEYLCLDGETHTSVFPRALALFLSRMFGHQTVKTDHA